MTATTAKDVRYYAVPDPAEPARMTFWRETSTGRRAWPKQGLWAGPEFTRRLRQEKPPEKRRLWREWLAAVDAEIEARPEAALARFAAIQSRCCHCGRILTDPASKVYGIGPECRADVLAPMLEHLAEQMRHAVGGAR